MKSSSTILLVLFSCLLASARPALGEQFDVFTLGRVTAQGPVAEVPLFVRDAPGTPLGFDQPPAFRIYTLSFNVLFNQAAVRSVRFVKGPLLTAASATFEISPRTPSSIAYIAAFDEPLPLRENFNAPGERIGTLVFELDLTRALPGTTIALTFDPRNALLGNVGREGIPAISETAIANPPTLQLIDGSIMIPRSEQPSRRKRLVRPPSGR